MSLFTGARLQASGQVRNTYDILTTAFAVAVRWVNTTHIRTPINPNGEKIPFDTGPDKSSRVYVRIHSVDIILTCDVAGAGVILDGWIYYQSPNNKRVYICPVRQSLAVNAVLSVTRPFFSDYSYNAESVSDIGFMAFENNASALGGSTFIDMLCRVNVGLYGIYSEPDFDTLSRIPPHEHTGLPWGIDVEV